MEAQKLEWCNSVRRDTALGNQVRPTQGGLAGLV